MLLISHSHNQIKEPTKIKLLFMQSQSVVFSVYYTGHVVIRPTHPVTHSSKPVEASARIVSTTVMNVVHTIVNVEGSFNNSVAVHVNIELLQIPKVSTTIMIYLHERCLVCQCKCVAAATRVCCHVLPFFELNLS